MTEIADISTATKTQNIQKRFFAPGELSRFKHMIG